MDIEQEIRRAMAKIRVAHEILASLDSTQEDPTVELLQNMAESLGNQLTQTELEVMSKFVGGQSPESIAEERQLNERTISNQIRSGYQKLGFTDRREFRGWAYAISGYPLVQPAKDELIET